MTQSEDQRAVAEYFASAGYRQRKAAPIQVADRAWVLDSVPLDHDVLPTTSFCWGLLGLIAILALFGFMIPLEVEWAGEFLNSGRPTFIVQTILFHTFLFPAAISFSFATVTPMFWYGSILLRFAIATLMVLPGCFMFCLSAWGTGDFLPHDDDFWRGFACVMFAHFLTAATIALTIQMWSPWALSHARPRDPPLPTLGTRSMMELTVIAAVGFACIVSIDAAEYIEGILFFVVVGAVSSLAVISLLIAFLREKHRNYGAAVISAALAFLGACLFTGLMAVVEFGWQSLFYDCLTVAAASIYGAVLICAVMWLCLWWLRSCGWVCIHRRDLRVSATQS